MKWGVKLKKTEFIKGKMIILQEDKVFVSIKFLELPHIKNIINMLKTNPGIWNRYPHELWLQILEWEVKYRNSQVDAIFRELSMNNKFSVLSGIPDNTLYEHI